MTPFCGWPVNGKPCGNTATPGCAYCDEHGEAFTRHPLTEADIVQRATARRTARIRTAVELAVVATIVAVAVLMPIHGWLYLHREFWWGVLAGSVAEAVVIISRRWAWDRVMWVRWFSR